MENQIVLTDSQLNEILETLHGYASGEDKYCYGLPMNESQMEDMRVIIRNVIKYTTSNK